MLSGNGWKMNTANLKGRLLKHYLVFSLLTIIPAVILFIFRGRRDLITYCAWSTGYLSVVLLAFTLVIGPLKLIRKLKNPLSTYFRRDIGIFAGVLAIVHSVTGLFVHLRGKMFLYFFKESESGYSIRFDSFGLANYTGLISAGLIIILLITSNDKTIIWLTPGKWKNIQRLSYLMFVLVLVHSYFYWVGGKNKDLLFYFYLPLMLVIVIMQFAGVIIHIRKQKLLSSD